MSLPVPPSAETILKNSIETLRDVLLPITRDDEWAKFNTGLLMGALEYALATLNEDRAAKHRKNLATVLANLRATLEASGQADLVTILDNPSPFEIASRLLVWGQNNPGDLAQEMQKALRGELYSQLEEELSAAAPIMGAFERGMRGEL